MIDDRDVRAFLDRMADEVGVPAPDPGPPVQRARRRRTRNVAGGAVLAVVLIPTILAGFSRMLRADAPTPARPTPSAVTSSSPPPVTPFRKDLVALDVSTGRTTPLPDPIRAIGGARNFSVSPDGRQVAFDGGARVYVSDVEGTNLRPVTDGGSAGAPSWSPDGRKIVFTDGDTDLLVIDLETGVISRLLQRRPLYRPTFSTDGRDIYFTGRRWNEPSLGLWMIPATGGAPTRVPIGRAAFGAFSPDGSTIAYRETGFDGRDITEMTHAVVYLTDAAGSYQTDGPQQRELDEPDRSHHPLADVVARRTPDRLRALVRTRGPRRRRRHGTRHADRRRHETELVRRSHPDHRGVPTSQGVDGATDHAVRVS